MKFLPATFQTRRPNGPAYEDRLTANPTGDRQRISANPTELTGDFSDSVDDQPHDPALVSPVWKTGVTIPPGRRYDGIHDGIYYGLLMMSLVLTTMTVQSHAEVTFNDHVKPILREACFNCHNPDKAKAELDLTTMAGIKSGAGGVEIAAAGRPDTSILYQSMAHLDGAEAMPPKKPKLSDDKLKVIRDWIAGGLVESAGGTSELRDLAAFEVSAVPASGTLAMPTNLPPLETRQRPATITALDASPRAPLLAVAGHERIHLFNTSSNLTELGALPFPEGTLHELRFSRDGGLLLAAGGRGAHSGLVALYDAQTGERKTTIGDETDAVLAADLSADNKVVALGGPNKIVKLFDTKTGKQLHKITKHTDWITAIRFSPDGTMFATGDRNGGIHVWETANAGIVFTLAEHQERITRLEWRPDGKMVASASDDGNLILWDMKDGWPARTVAAHKAKTTSRYSRQTGVLGLGFAATGRLVTAGRNRQLKVWKADGGREFESPALPELPTAATISPDGKTLFVGCYRGELQAWDWNGKQARHSRVIR